MKDQNTNQLRKAIRTARGVVRQAEEALASNDTWHRHGHYANPGYIGYKWQGSDVKMDMSVDQKRAIMDRMKATELTDAINTASGRVFPIRMFAFVLTEEQAESLILGLKAVLSLHHASTKLRELRARLRKLKGRNG